MNHAILLISCPDQKGITASITNFVYSHSGNIVHADQHIDEQNNTFFMRIEWDMVGFGIEKGRIEESFEEIAQRFKMTWELYFSQQLPRVAVFVSKQLHCIRDLLYKQRAGHLRCEIPVIISNHPGASRLTGEFGIRFEEVPVTAENKMDQEKRELQILNEENIDLIVLARYHQVLTKQFVEIYPNRIINIHHSFLPAFAGKNPYAQAYQKGVKIIGATSHYVTEELDQGPIIDQDTVRISHRDSLKDLLRKGEDLEKIVLSRAIRYALEHKILCYGNKTVVFD